MNVSVNMTMNRNRLSVCVSVLALLGGCVAVPAAPDYYEGAPSYYGPAPAYIAPLPLYFGPPGMYYGPRVYVRPHIGGASHGGAGHGGKRGSGSGRGHGRR